MRVPLVDLAWQHRQVEAEVRQGWDRVLERTAFVLGEEVADFESGFAAFSGVRHCIGVASGTDAIEIALRALGIGSGDEVIVPANTFIASAAGVVRAGAKPVLADVDPSTLLLDPEAAAGCIGDRTRAILPVHLYGQMAPLGALAKVAAEAGIPIVEDAAQSQGAAQDGAPSGSVGKVAATSFYPGKNLGAYGDAGGVTTDDEEVARACRSIRDHGSTQKYVHEEFGFTSRLDTIHAVVLSAKLKRLEEWNSLRREAAARYDVLLAGVEGVDRPTVATGNTPVWHLYVVQVDERDRVLDALHADGVGAAIHYPTPVHLHGAMADLGYRAGEFPVSEAAAGRILTLPLFPGITAKQQEYVAEKVAAAVRG
jgi:dTDP-4-amino-4,6-dideoxygalactose transaminase